MQVTLLSSGYMMYSGEREGLVPWFTQGCGYPYDPPMHGLASDWVMDLVNVGFTKPEVRRSKNWPVGLAPWLQCFAASGVDMQQLSLIIQYTHSLHPDEQSLDTAPALLLMSCAAAFLLASCLRCCFSLSAVPVWQDDGHPGRPRISSSSIHGQVPPRKQRLQHTP